MRTVAEILESISDSRFNIPMPFNYNMLHQAINEARKEAIEECAGKIKADENGYPVALSVSILSLIKDLK